MEHKLKNNKYCKQGERNPKQNPFFFLYFLFAYQHNPFSDKTRSRLGVDSIDVINGRGSEGVLCSHRAQFFIAMAEKEAV